MVIPNHHCGAALDGSIRNSTIAIYERLAPVW
jgi:hypothetical protein